jgi:hypothetical protein
LNNKTLKSPIDVYRKWVPLRLYFINHEKLKKENYKPFTARLKQNKVSESKSCGCMSTKEEPLLIKEMVSWPTEMR